MSNQQHYEQHALHVLQTVFGYPAFRGQQAEIVSQVANGGDALVLDADRRRQVAVLPDSGHGARRRGRGDLAPDRADARPGGRAGRSRRARRLPQFHADVSTRPCAPSAGAQRRTRPALRRAGAPADAALPGIARFVEHCPVCHRRGALRVAMGARLPSRIHQAVGAARTLSQRAAHCPHRHGRCADARRNHPSPAA
jgi:hypothetical protein